MRITYQLAASQHIPLTTLPTPQQLDNSALVEWDRDAEGKLSGMRIIFTNQRVYFNQVVRQILPSNPNLEAEAFAVASFINDCIQTLHGADGFRPRAIEGTSPQLAPETADEEAFLRDHLTVHMSGVGRLTATLTVSFTMPQLAPYQDRAVPIAHFARGLRAHEYDPFEEYDEYFKAVEYFAPIDPKSKSGRQVTKEDFAIQMSKHASPIDHTFIKDRIMELREIRDRITHPKADAGHLDPQRLEYIREVSAALADMKTLARLFITQPPPWKW